MVIQYPTAYIEAYPETYLAAVIYDRNLKAALNKVKHDRMSKQFVHHSELNVLHRCLYGLCFNGVCTALEPLAKLHGPFFPAAGVVQLNS